MFLHFWGFLNFKSFKMYPTVTTIHYNRHLIVRIDFGKFKWRGNEFDTEEQAFKAIDDKILNFKKQ